MTISYVFTFKFILTRLNHIFLKTFDVVLIFWKQVPGNFGHLMAQCHPSCQVSSSLIVTVLLLFFWKLINQVERFDIFTSDFVDFRESFSHKKVCDFCFSLLPVGEKNVCLDFETCKYLRPFAAIQNSNIISIQYVCF